MLRFFVCLALICAGCGPVEQPESAKTVAAYEVSLPTAADKLRFLQLLRTQAEAFGYHVDAATASELRVQSEVSPITFNATVWRGDDDDEPMASAMDFEDRIGRVWVSFSLGEDPDRSTLFRNATVLQMKNEFPSTLSLPIMPNGATPHKRFGPHTDRLFGQPFSGAQIRRRTMS